MKKFSKPIADIPEKSLIYGGNDMHNEKFYTNTGRKKQIKVKTNNFKCADK